MATRPAKRGSAKGTKQKPAKPLPALKKRPIPKTHAKRGQGKAPAAQALLLQKAFAETPDITSEQFALKFNLPIEEVIRHRAFVLQYMLDYNVEAAALRMGYPEATAYQTGKLMLHYAFSQIFLRELQHAKTIETVLTVGDLVSKAWEEANRPDTTRDGCAMTNSATRIAALKMVGKWMGLETPKPKEEALVIRRIMYVGEQALKQAGTNLDEWGAVATRSQKRLKQSTAIDV